MRAVSVVAVVLVLVGVSVSAQSFMSFTAKPPAAFVAPSFGDDEIAGLIGTLDKLLAVQPAKTSWRDAAADALLQFARRIQTGQLSRTQEQIVLDHLDRVATSRPEAAAIVAGFVGWGTKTGGFLGLEGEYGFQHAEINPWWQFVGVVAIILVSGIPTLIVAMIACGVLNTMIERVAYRPLRGAPKSPIAPRVQCGPWTGKTWP